MAQDVIITEDDCGTSDGIYVEPIIESGEIIEPLRDRIVGRVALEDQLDYEGNMIVSVNQEITEDLASAIQAAGIERVKIRSVLTCESKRGVCQLCYGRNLATGRMVERGEAVGIISAQSIGEPGTQLTMRTFHIGGAATGQRAIDAGRQVRRIRASSSTSTRFEHQGRTDRHEPQRHPRHPGRKGPRKRTLPGRLRREDSLSRTARQVKANEILLEWDPYTFSILTEVSGAVHFKDLIDGITMQEQVDEITGHSQWVVTDSTDEKRVPTDHRAARRRQQARRKALSHADARSLDGGGRR